MRLLSSTEYVDYAYLFTSVLMILWFAFIFSLLADAIIDMPATSPGVHVILELTPVKYI